MQCTIDKTKDKKICFSENELEYKIKIATETLDRNINFVSNCDNKTSIILATVGVLFTIILTNNEMSNIYKIVKKCIEIKSFFSISYLTCFFASLVAVIFGICILGTVLLADTSKNNTGRKDTYSNVFFDGIDKCGNYQMFAGRFYKMDKKTLLDDLTEQIYINAKIASMKYKRYNAGVKWTVLGSIIFIVTLFLGVGIIL